MNTLHSPILTLLELQAAAVAEGDYLLAETLCQNIQNEWDRLSAPGSQNEVFLRRIRELTRENLMSLSEKKTVLERRVERLRGDHESVISSLRPE